jgi:transcriptional regulator with XRE-family HTH domain
MPTIYEQIGQRIRELREAAGMSQSALAAELDEAANTVSRWETGTYKVTPENLDRLARLFKVSITVFFPSVSQDEGRIAALTSATGGLDKKDFEEVIRYAEFRKVRQAMELAKKSRKKG